MRQRTHAILPPRSGPRRAASPAEAVVTLRTLQVRAAGEEEIRRFARRTRREGGEVSLAGLESWVAAEGLLDLGAGLAGVFGTMAGCAGLCLAIPAGEEAAGGRWVVGLPVRAGRVGGVVAARDAQVRALEVRRLVRGFGGQEVVSARRGLLDLAFNHEAPRATYRLTVPLRARRTRSSLPICVRQNMQRIPVCFTSSTSLLRCFSQHLRHARSCSSSHVRGDFIRICAW